jgi:predicted metal-dependent enzyme (double-stranded beta helix superfamily)
MFDVDTLIADCVACLSDPEPRRAIRETVTQAIHEPNIASTMAPSQAGITLLHRSDVLTVSQVVWAPHMRVFPHDHRMWACIGVYTGAEDNEFFRRASGDRGSGLESLRGRRIDEGEALLLGDDTIHAVTNAVGRLTAALHVYGGDFVAQPRSQWCEPDLIEEPYDTARVAKLFADANAAFDT